MHVFFPGGGQFLYGFLNLIFFGHPMALRLEQHVGLVDLFQIEMKHDIT